MARQDRWRRALGGDDWVLEWCAVSSERCDEEEEMCMCAIDIVNDDDDEEETTTETEAASSSEEHGECACG